MAKRDNTLIWVVGGAAALWWLSGRRGAGAPVNGDEVPHSRALPIVPDGYANVGGSVGSIDAINLAQKPYFPGGTVTGSVAWRAQTTNSNGIPISWPYKLIVRLEHFTWGVMTAVQEWDSYTVSRADQPHGDVLSNFTLKIPEGTKQGDLGQIRVELTGARSDSSGNSISGDYTSLAKGEKEDAIIVMNPDVYAHPGGMVGDITLMKGTAMKNLRLRQARPPGGYENGIGEDRQWPMYGDNLSLPGVKILVRQKQPTFGDVSHVGYGRRMTVV